MAPFRKLSYAELLALGLLVQNKQQMLRLVATAEATSNPLSRVPSPTSRPVGNSGRGAIVQRVPNTIPQRLLPLFHLCSHISEHAYWYDFYYTTTSTYLIRLKSSHVANWSRAAVRQPPDRTLHSQSSCRSHWRPRSCSIEDAHEPELEPETEPELGRSN